MKEAALSGVYCVFAKWPLPGAVKTRLATHVGSDTAAALARAMLEDTLARLSGDRVPVVLAVDRPDAALGVGVPTWGQGEGNLGARMGHVLARALTQHEWAIAFGTDSPTLPSRCRASAVTSLTRAGGPDAVLGPTRDGGYYLIGLRRLAIGMWDGIRWSTRHALQDTVQGLQRCDMSVEVLEPWFDVDEWADLQTLASELAAHPDRAPRTADAIRRLCPQARPMGLAADGDRSRRWGRR